MTSHVSHELEKELSIRKKGSVHMEDSARTEASARTEQLVFPDHPQHVDGSKCKPGVQGRFQPGAKIVDINNKSYIVDVHGHAVPVLVESSKLSATSKFYHQPIPTNEHTPPRKLFQLHAELLQSIDYDWVMDISTSNRFGKWDTTLSIHKMGQRGTGKSSDKSDFGPDN